MGGQELSLRIGHGYDVHRFAENRRLVLGGVDIPFEKGLLGHSDADVLTHALMDALLGAMGEGDIGKLFPDSDMKYKDISSLLLLREVRRHMETGGYCLVNADCTVIAQAPKLAPYIPAMRRRLSETLGCEAACLNIKATTEEHLGFTGRLEGVSAHAVCLLQKI